MMLYTASALIALWLVHVRLGNAYAPGHHRTGVGAVVVQGPYRRAHYPTSPHGGVHRKKWFAPHHGAGVSQPPSGMNQRIRRPPVSPFKRHEFAIPATTNSLSNARKPATASGQQSTVGAPPPFNPTKPSKQFQASPKIHGDLEYHIQSNHIPHSQPVFIKQVEGEKGPIHTIPAPNLSPADKPKQVFVERSPHEAITLRTRKPYYQVSEAPDQQDDSVAAVEPNLQAPSPIHSPADLDTLSVQRHPQLQQHLLQQQQQQTATKYHTMLQPQFFLKERAPAFDALQKHASNYEEPSDAPLQQKKQQKQASAPYSLPQGSADLHFESSKHAAISVPPLEAGITALKLQHADQMTSAGKPSEIMIYVPDDVEHTADDGQQFHSAPRPTPKTRKKFSYGHRITPKIT